MSISDPILDHVIEVFRQTFPDDPIDRESDFFELGGDSLTIVTFCAALEERLGCEVHPSMMVYYPTAEELAAELSERPRTGV